jgi:hypothetical protein
MYEEELVYSDGENNSGIDVTLHKTVSCVGSSPTTSQISFWISSATQIPNRMS